MQEKKEDKIEIPKKYKVADDVISNKFQKESDMVFENLKNQPEVIQALKYYTTDNYQIINDFLFEKEKFNNEFPDIVTINMNKDISNIQKAMDSYRLDEDVIVYRGTKLKYYDNYKIGDIFEGKVFYSTSLKEENAMEFFDGIKYYDENKDKAVLLEIRVPKETKSIYIGKNTSYSENEYELLLSYKTKYKILKNNGDKMILEVVTDD